ncbi:polyketide synthase dehydratase-domain-containing protein, partial [Xylariaceae sp. FL1272]
LQLVGTLFCLGYSASVIKANNQVQGEHAYLVDCPAYPFDHSRRYWEESRSKTWRLRESSPTFLLGRRNHDLNPLRPRCRNWLCVETSSWLGEHEVTGVLVLPGTGSLVIAMEAVREICATGNRNISGFYFKNFELLSPLRIGQTARDAVETEVHLYPIKVPGEKEPTWFQFRIFSHNNGRTTETCNAQVQVQYEEDATTPAGRESLLEQDRIRKRYHEIRSVCTQSLDTKTFYKEFFKYEFKYGPSYNVVSDTSFDPVGQLSSAGKVNWNPAVHEQVGKSPIHPAILDGVLQVLLATSPKGLKNTSTMIPRRIGTAWVSNKVWCQVTTTVNAAGVVSETLDEGGPFMNFLALADDGAPLCALENVQAAEISQVETTNDETGNRDLLYNMVWQPRLSSLEPHQLSTICEAASSSPHSFDSDAAAFKLVFPKIELVLRLAAEQTLKDMTADHINQLPIHLRNYVDLLIRQGVI